MRRIVLSALLLALVLSAPSPVAATARDPDAVYFVYVGAESADFLHLIRFGPEGARVERTIPVGEMATEIEGPHGLALSPDGRHLYMTTGHGVPDGKLWKFEAGTEAVLAEPTLLGLFPATLDLTPDGLYAFVVNFNLHGEMVPSTVSVVYTPDLIEVTQVEACTMPHGMRLSPDGAHAYLGCMMDDELIELDTRAFAVARRFSVATGAEGPIAPAVDHAAMGHDGMDHAAMGHDGMDHAAMDHGGMDHGGMNQGGMDHGGMNPSCSPTWAEPSTDGARVWVACNRSDEILEIDRADWQLVRRLATGRGPYNLEVTPDGRLLIATLKQGAGVQIFDAGTGESLATFETTAPVAHGVVVSPDSRYAFVSVEGIGAEPGKVDILDLERLAQVASVEVGQQAGGIAFWKMEPSR